MRIGFIGLGKMGLPMAENVARKTGYEVLAFDRSEAAREPLKKHPGWGKILSLAEHPADFAGCEVVITMLPDSSITNEVLTGKTGLAEHLSTGAVIIDMGSSNPSSTIEQGNLLKEIGIDLVDAPVSGSVPKARAGELAIMMGGAEGALGERVRPILKTMGATIIPTGALGSAHAMKTLNNYVYAAGLLAVSEAATLGRAMGLDLDILADVINASSGRNVASETKLRQFVLSGSYAGGFGLRLMAKDLRTAAALQEFTGLSAPQLDLCNTLWAEASDALPENADNTEIHRFLNARKLMSQEVH